MEDTLLDSAYAYADLLLFSRSVILATLFKVKNCIAGYIRNRAVSLSDLGLGFLASRASFRER